MSDKPKRPCPLEEVEEIHDLRCACARCLAEAHAGLDQRKRVVDAPVFGAKGGLELWATDFETLRISEAHFLGDDGDSAAIFTRRQVRELITELEDWLGEPPQSQEESHTGETADRFPTIAEFIRAEVRGISAAEVIRRIRAGSLDWSIFAVEKRGGRK